MVKERRFKHSVNHSTNMRITLKDFQYELILKYLILVTEIYVSILFFINVFPTWLINQRYPCVDILPPSLSVPSQGSKRKISVLPTGPLQRQCEGQEDEPCFSVCALCLDPDCSFCTVHVYLTKGYGPVVYLVQTQHAQGPTMFVASIKKMKNSFKFLTMCHILIFFKKCDS